MAIKASAQTTLIDLTDAYSVILSNEAHTWLGDTDSVQSTQSCKIQVIAMRGADIVPCSVDVSKITKPTGISVSNDNKTPSPTLTVTATTACTTAGMLDIPIVIDDITVTKTFSYAIAYTGAEGQDGISITGTNITYQVGTSPTTYPTGTWSSSVPTVPAGQYLWTRTEITKSDGSKVYAYSVSSQGTNGNDGKGIKTTTVNYATSTDGKTPPSSGWGTSIPTVSAGSYLWTRTEFTYTDNTKTTTYSVSHYGTNGRDGENGEDAITMAITSSDGIIFKNTAIATTLTAHVYKGGVEMTSTALSALGAVKWYKDKETTAKATGSTLVISANDVNNAVTYTAQLED